MQRLNCEQPPMVGEAQAVGRILENYVEIHNDIFATSFVRTLRRRVPIPGFFAAIDFEAHNRSLGTLCIQLEAICEYVNSGAAASSLSAPLASYSVALLAAIRKLAGICVELSRRAADPHAYTMPQYREDLQEYESLVAEYQSLGDQLNRALRAPLS